MQRVKVYRLNSDGLWDDKGTGHVSVEYLEVGYLGCCKFFSLPASHQGRLRITAHISVVGSYKIRSRAALTTNLAISALDTGSHADRIFGCLSALCSRGLYFNFLSLSSVSSLSRLSLFYLIFLHLLLSNHPNISSTCSEAVRVWG